MGICDTLLRKIETCKGGRILETCVIKMVWEDDIWCAESIDMEFDLVLESDSFDTLIERVKIAVKDILEVDFKYTGDIQFVFQAERMDNVKGLVS